MALLCYTLILAVAVFVGFSPSGFALKSEKELRRELFKDYCKYSRPVKRHATAVPVDIAVTVLKLRKMDEREQIISLETWMRLRWTDEYLRWNPDEYDNITALHVPPLEIWRPDVSLYTASPDTSLIPTAHTNAIVFNTGKVLWVPPYTINSRCPLPLKSDPNKARAIIECNIRMGSWTHSGNLLDLQLADDEVDLTNFEDYNPEWKLIKIDSNRESKLYDCCPDEYPLINFNVTLKNRYY